jgi:hypothetical protein
LTLPDFGVSIEPTFFAHDTAKRRLWLLDNINEWIWVIDELTNTYLRRVMTGATTGNCAIIYDAPSRRMVVEGNDQVLRFIHPDSFRVLHTMPTVCNAPNRHLMGYDSVNGHVYISPYRLSVPGGQLVVIDVRHRTELYRDTMPYETDCLIFCPNVGKAYIGGRSGGPVYRLFDLNTESWADSALVAPTDMYDAFYVPNTGHVLQCGDGTGGTYTRIYNLLTDTQEAGGLAMSRISGAAIDTCSDPNRLFVVGATGAGDRAVEVCGLPSYGACSESGVYVFIDFTDVVYSRKANHIYAVKDSNSVVTLPPFFV